MYDNINLVWLDLYLITNEIRYNKIKSELGVGHPKNKK